MVAEQQPQTTLAVYQAFQQGTYPTPASPNITNSYAENNIMYQAL